jgi:release factor glutamine methyltransferase
MNSAQLIQKYKNDSLLKPYVHEIDLIFEGVLKKTRSIQSKVELYSGLEISLEEEKTIEKLFELKKEGRPLQYLLESAPFYESELTVGPGVLIPRPETEYIVDTLVSYMKALPENQKIFGIEIGLGSGAIALSLLKHFSQLTMWGSEAFSEAAQYCERVLHELNDKSRLKILRVSPDQVLEPFHEKKGAIDFLVSNPPYMDRSDEIDSSVLHYEPHSALFPENGNSNYFYEKIAKEARSLLKPTGFLALEIPHQRTQKISDLFLKSEWTLSIFNDLALRPRLLMARPRERSFHG